MLWEGLRFADDIDQITNDELDENVKSINTYGRRKCWMAVDLDNNYWVEQQNWR